MLNKILDKLDSIFLPNEEEKPKMITNEMLFSEVYNIKAEKVKEHTTHFEVIGTTETRIDKDGKTTIVRKPIEFTVPKNLVTEAMMKWVYTNKYVLLISQSSLYYFTVDVKKLYLPNKDNIVFSTFDKELVNAVIEAAKAVYAFKYIV
jgi:hypothetical protein